MCKAIKFWRRSSVFMIIIDAGHGGSDPGAHGNGVTEKDWTLEVSLHQYEFLKKLGIPSMLKKDRRYITIRETFKLSETFGSICVY